MNKIVFLILFLFALPSITNAQEERLKRELDGFMNESPKEDEESLKDSLGNYMNGSTEEDDDAEPAPDYIEHNGFQAQIDWLSKDGFPISQDISSNLEYEVKFGINSNSRIVKWKLYVNKKKYTTSSDHRGIGVGRNDGYDISDSRLISLKPGVNLIELLAKSNKGKWARSQVLCVTYKPDSYTSSQQEKRIALVVGNSNYQAIGMNLKNSKNDATDVAQKLSALGFYVIKGIDVKRSDFNDKINEFGKIARSYDVALFFYAGHGMQSKGVNYLIPTDAILKEENEIEDKCVDANKVLRTLEEANCKANILILDACRNNAFERSWHRGVADGGLAAMSGPFGTFIAYSTSPGKVAKDGNIGDRNSPYTKALLHQLDVPNLSLAQFLENVLIEVDNATNHSQQPWTTSSFAGSFIFNKK